MPLSFLTARWSNLCLLTYPVPPALLEPRFPPRKSKSFEGEIFSHVEHWIYVRLT